MIPESLFRIDMLYFSCVIKGVELKAFIDTGAQMSIMSKKFANIIEYSDLIDERYKGVALGVGKQDILGKIHYLEVDIPTAKVTIPCSFSVLDQMEMDIIFGLDMLISHGAILDMGKKCMKINGIEIKFVKK